MMNKKQYILFCILIGFLAPVIGQSLSDQAEISLLTCAPGNDIYTVYGHNAIRVKDPVYRLDKVYNYGTFDFREPNFMMKFLRGKLRYRIASTGFKRFMAEYNYEERGVSESVFNFSLDQKQLFYQLLETNLKPENKFYMYDFFYDNCATRIRDIVEKVVTKQLKYPEEVPNISLRNMLDEYTFRDQWLTFGQSLIVGANADIKADVRQQMFIPNYLDAHFSKTSFTKDNSSLFKRKHSLMKFDHNYPKTIFKPVYLFLLILLWELFLFFKSSNTKWLRTYDRAVYIIMGLASILILVMWFLTDHGATKDNWNILWVNPLFIAILFTSSKHKYWKHLVHLLLGFLILALFYKFLPQDYYPGVSILIVALILNLLRKKRTSYLKTT